MVIFKLIVKRPGELISRAAAPVLITAPSLATLSHTTEIMKDKDQDKGWWTRKKNEYRQQVSWVWKPKYSVETMSLPFLLIGTVYFLLGVILCFYQQNTPEEFVWDYTSCTTKICRNSSLNLQGMDDSR